MGGGWTVGLPSAFATASMAALTADTYSRVGEAVGLCVA